MPIGSPSVSPENLEIQRPRKLEKKLVKNKWKMNKPDLWNLIIGRDLRDKKLIVLYEREMSNTEENLK